MRAALSDLYFHSTGLVGLNVLWGSGVLAVAFAALTWSPVALALTPLLAIPAAGTVRLAARIVREDSDRSVRGALYPSASIVVGAVLAGTAVLTAQLVLASNSLIGLTGAQPLEWLVGTLAAWGLVVMWGALLIAVPLLVDPRRAHRPARDRLRLAAAVLLANPGRTATLGGLTAVFLVISAILVVVLFSTSLALASLVACRVVYPLADRLDGNPGGRP